MFGVYRTFLALLVVAYHIGGITSVGSYAVFGFYILSGYLMTLIMQNNYGYSVSGVSKYGLNRFLRIYPIYWISILFSAILVMIFGSEFTSTFHKAIYMPEDYVEILKNIFLFFPFRELPRLTPPAWALTVEIFFYILIGLGISKNKKLTLIWFLISVFYHLYVYIEQLGWQYKYFTIFAASLPFSTGSLIFHYKEKLIGVFVKLKLDGKYSPYLFLLLVSANSALGYSTSLSETVFFYSNYFLCAVMVVVLSEKKSLPFISRKFDKWMGDFSYPIYLVHYQVSFVVVVALSVFGVTIDRHDMTLFVLSIPFIFLVSWAIVVFAERPIEFVREKVKA